MIEREARMARKAWGLSMDASVNAHSDVMSLHTTLVAQHALILDLHAADRRRQGVIKELLAADHTRQVQLTKALSLLSIMGYSQLAVCIDLLFCLATQYRSFVQVLAILNNILSVTDVMSLHTTLVAHHALILDLHAADRRRQGVIKELLAADHTRQVQLTKALRLLKGLQTQMI
nr:hypothetical protein [Tanacetum cinerariifolium]